MSQALEGIPSSNIGEEENISGRKDETGRSFEPDDSETQNSK